MPAAKPVKVPEWSSNSGGVEPPAPKKAAGFSPAEKPAAQYVNWLFWLIWQWVLYLEDLEAQTLQWSVSQTFNAGLVVQNEGINNAAVFATAVSGDHAGVRGQGHGAGAGVVGLGEATGTGVRGIGGVTSGHGVYGESDGPGDGGNFFGGGGNGVYAEGVTAGVVGTCIGANGNGGTFIGTGTARGVEAFNAGSGLALHASRGAAPAAAAVTCYMDGKGTAAAVTAVLHLKQLLDYRTPAIYVEQGTIIFGGTQPTKTEQLQVNTLAGALVDKAWANVEINAGALTHADGVGFSSITHDASKVIFVMSRAMVNTTYAPVVTACKLSGGGIFTQIQIVNSTTFYVDFRDSADNPIAPNGGATGLLICVHVKGRQS